MNSLPAVSFVSNLNASVKGPFKLNEGAVLRHPNEYKDEQGIFNRVAMVADYNRAMSPSPFELSYCCENSPNLNASIMGKAERYYDVLMAPMGCKTEEEIKGIKEKAYLSTIKIRMLFEGNKKDLLLAFTLAFNGYLSTEDSALKQKLAVSVVTLTMAYRYTCSNREIKNDGDLTEVERRSAGSYPKVSSVTNFSELFKMTWQHAEILYKLEQNYSEVGGVVTP